MPFTLPDFNSDTFCSVIPMCSANSFERILRRASMTSRLTTIGIWEPLNDFRLIFSHLRCGLENVSKREDENCEDCVKQILWEKIVVATWRDRYELTHQYARDHDAHEHANDDCGYSGEAGAAQPKGSIDGEDVSGEIGAGEPPNTDDDDRSGG